MRLADQLRLTKSSMTARGSRSITLAMVLAVLLISATWAAISGLMQGAEQVSRHRVKSRALSRRLLVGDEYLNPQLLASQVDDLEKTLRAELGDRLERVSPFQILDWQLQTPGKSSSQAHKGRTMNLASGAAPPTHPLFEDLKLVTDRSQEFSEGLFLCPRLFSKPGWNIEDVPKEVTVNYIQDGNSEERTLKVRGVLAADPPDLVYYILPEDEVASLYRSPSAKFAGLTPLDSRWVKSHTDEDGMSRVEQAAEAIEGIEKATIDFKKNSLQVVLHRDQKAWSPAEWAKFGKTLAERLGSSASGERTAPAALSQVKTGKEASNPVRYYPLVELYFEDHDDFPEAVRILTSMPELKGKVDQVIAELVTQLRSFSAAKEAILETVQLGLILLAALCLTIIQFLRCVQRRPEAGMLKAMGQSNFDLACVAAWEGTFLWLFGTSGGLLAGWMVGTQRARLVYAGEEGSMGFAFTWVDAGFAALAIWIVATLSVQLAASWLWYWRQPAGLLDAT